MKIATYQRQRYQWAPAGPLALAGVVKARRGLPAGTESASGEVSSSRAGKTWLWRDLAGAKKLERGRYSREGR